jgi:hypothetical protein
MKHTWKAALAVAAVAMIGTAGAAKAAVTLDGQTGLFINPTAEVVKQGNGELQGNYQHTSSFYGDSLKNYGIGGAYGVADKLELSANYAHYSAFSESANEWRVGAKYQLFNQREKGFDLAVGGNYANASGSLVDDGFNGSLKHENLYVAATKGFGYSESRAPIKATLGLRWDHFSADGDSTSKASVYAGAEVPLSSDGQFSLIGEVGSKIADYASTPYAIGLRYHPKNSQFSVGAGFGRPSYISQDPGAGTTLFAQVGYNFGK